MKAEKTILIGADVAGNLVSILNCIQKSNHYAWNIITASRITDLTLILTETVPDLIISCFKDNQAGLNAICDKQLALGIPVLCLEDKNNYMLLHWNINAIVFVYAFEMIDKEFYLANRINSIFLLKAKTVSENKIHTFVPSAESTSEISRYVMELDRKKEVLYKVKDRIKSLYPNVNDPTRKELISIVNLIKTTANDKKLWDDFKYYFEHLHQGFLQKITSKHPCLTPVDLKYCCYLKMNMSNDDIKNILGINQESVRTHTYRLKLKMELSKKEDLRYYLRSVS